MWQFESLTDNYLLVLKGSNFCIQVPQFVLLYLPCLLINFPLQILHYHKSLHCHSHQPADKLSGMDMRVGVWGPLFSPPSPHSPRELLTGYTVIVVLYYSKTDFSIIPHYFSYSCPAKIFKIMLAQSLSFMLLWVLIWLMARV